MVVFPDYMKPYNSMLFEILKLWRKYAYDFAYNLF